MTPRSRRTIWPTMIFAVGLVWILQGFDVFGQDGGMNGEQQWILIGGIVSAIGLALLVREFRR
jgi:hypothetical protein